MIHNILRSQDIWAAILENACYGSTPPPSPKKNMMRIIYKGTLDISVENKHHQLNFIES